MAFSAPEAYDRSIGRYSRELAPRFVTLAGVSALSKGPILDVGCGPGALSAWLAERFGPSAVAAVDPSEPFVLACRAHVPGADVRVAKAEALPFPDGRFGAALAQLVLSQVTDAQSAAAEMRRVVRPGGIVAACTFEASGPSPAQRFWQAARRVDPAGSRHEGRLLRADELLELWRGVGLREARTGEIDVEVDYDGFDDFFVPFSSGVGPMGDYFLAQPEERQRALRDACFEDLGRPRGGVSLRARVVGVTGLA